MLAWTYLMVAGLLEIGWAVGLKYTEGFTKPLASALTILAIAGSMFLLAKAAETIPIGTAYGIWVGIGVVGTAVLGTLLFHEPMSALRVVFVALLVVALVGIKLTSHS